MALTGNWNSLGDVFYRKVELYSMEWADNIDLQRYKIAAAPYAGPLALVRKEMPNSKALSKPIIVLFTSAGKEMTSIKWNSGQLLDLGWTCNEELLCIQDDGSVLVYDIFGQFKRTFSMGQEAKEVKVVECKIFNSYNGTGVAILIGTNRFYVINNVEDPRIRRLADIPGMEKMPSCWCVINRDRQSRVLVAKDADLYLLDHGGQYQQQRPEISGTVGSYIDMAISFNNNYLALFTDTGLLWIGSADLEKVYCEFDTKCPSIPQQLVWCGTGAIVGYWDNILLMVGPQKDWVKYTNDTPVHLVQEIDGLRIVGHYTQELLQRVPGVTENIFKIGSMCPGAMLYEASKEFQRGSQRADEYIRMIKDRLDVAVEECIEAAGHEWEPKMQKDLLKAASFGKCFLTDYKPEKFVTMCQWLRVLNAVRDFKIGIPITYPQLKSLTMKILIDRLVLRRHYYLAIKICQYLKLPDAEGASRVLAHWACYKVQQSNIDDESIARAIAQKLGDSPGISYSEIANKAVECGRKDLATRLLDFEAKAAEQVPLLMKMKKDKLALHKAIESGDTDLVYTVLLQIKATLPQGDFFMAIRSLPTAHALYLQYCRQQENQAMLRDLYYQEDNFLEEAHCRIQESYLEDRIEARLAHLVAAQSSFSKARSDWGAKQTEEQMKLMKYQRRLEEELNRPYLDLSLHKTISKLIMENNHKLAEQLRKEFKVPDRRFWWLKIQALSEAGDWTELETFSKSKKSPIGYEPFVDVCLENYNKHEAAKYLPKVTPENKVKYYVKTGNLEEAADFAFQMKNVDELNFVLMKCSSNQLLASKVENMKHQLSK